MLRKPASKAQKAQPIFRNVCFAGLFWALLGATSIDATPVGVGSFGLTGTMYVDSTSIQFYLNSLGDESARIQAPLTGVFMGLGGEMAGVTNLPATAGSAAVTSWVTLPDSITLDALTIPAQTTATYPLCTGTMTDDLLQACSLTSDPALLLTKTSTGVTVQLSVLGNAYTGSSSTGTTPFVGLLTSPYAQAVPSLFGVETELNTTGHISSTLAADVTTIPEPGMLAAFGLSMLVLVSLRKTLATRG
jgi:hypothetical protein